VIGVKEASGNMTQICQVRHAVPSQFIVLSGDDALTLPAMAVGARGVISVASNVVPGLLARMVEAFDRGDVAAARDLHQRLLPLMLANFIESNPGPVKAALAMMGLIREQYRLPMVPPRQDTRARLERVMAELGLTRVQDIRGTREIQGIEDIQGSAQVQDIGAVQPLPQVHDIRRTGS
jgi:4-hydroxy-tetrahydrodipicolinate synthase